MSPSSLFLGSMILRHIFCFYTCFPNAGYTFYPLSSVQLYEGCTGNDLVCPCDIVNHFGTLIFREYDNLKVRMHTILEKRKGMYIKTGAFIRTRVY